MGARFASRFHTPAAAMILMAGLLGACDSTQETPDQPPAEEEEAVTDEDGPFARALNFACEGGARIDLAMRSETEPVLFRIDRGEARELQPDPPPEGPITWNGDGPLPTSATWRDSAASVALDLGGDVVYTAGGAPRRCEFVARALPAPRVEGVDVYVQGSQAGSTIDVSVGERFAISLSGVPTAGYMWAVEALPDFLEKTGETGGSTSTAQFLPGFAGGNHWEVLVFDARAAGQGELVLVQRRPWEDAGQPDDQRFKLNVRVR